MAKLLVEEPDALMRARPDLWEPWVSNHPGPPGPNAVRRLPKVRRPGARCGFGHNVGHQRVATCESTIAKPPDTPLRCMAWLFAVQLSADSSVLSLEVQSSCSEKNRQKK